MGIEILLTVIPALGKLSQFSARMSYTGRPCFKIPTIAQEIQNTSRIEEWRNGYKHLLLLHRIWVRFSAPVCRLPTICNGSSRDSDALYGLCWHQTYMQAKDPYTWKDNTPKHF